MKTHLRKRGFTLVEVLIVVIIIAVLAAITIPRFAGQTRKAQLAEVKHLCGMISRAEIRYFDLHGDLTLDLSKLDIKLPASTAFPGCSYYGWGHPASTEIGFGLGCDAANPDNVRAHILGMDMDVLNGQPKITHFWKRTDLPGQIGGGDLYMSPTDWESGTFYPGI